MVVCQPCLPFLFRFSQFKSLPWCIHLRQIKSHGAGEWFTIASMVPKTDHTVQTIFLQGSNVYNMRVTYAGSMLMYINFKRKSYFNTLVGMDFRENKPLPKFSQRPCQKTAKRLNLVGKKNEFFYIVLLPQFPSRSDLLFGWGKSPKTFH